MAKALLHVLYKDSFPVFCLAENVAKKAAIQIRVRLKGIQEET